MLSKVGFFAWKVTWGKILTIHLLKKKRKGGGVGAVSNKYVVVLALSLCNGLGVAFFD